jgi:hypothetical protein
MSQGRKGGLTMNKVLRYSQQRGWWLVDPVLILCEMEESGEGGETDRMTWEGSWLVEPFRLGSPSLVSRPGGGEPGVRGRAGG